MASRRLEVLNAIVDMYVRSGEPVSSKSVCDLLDFSVSAATIRNDMAFLEHMGLLDKPHTSAGRIPSHLGYREYIDNLRYQNPTSISNYDKDLINSCLSSEFDPEKLLEEASHLLAKMTKFVAISTAPPEDNSVIRKVDFVQTGRYNLMMVVITSTGLIKNKLLRSNIELSGDILKLFYRVINEKFTGVFISEITEDFILNISKSLGELSGLFSPLFDALWEISKEILGASINLDGQNNLLLLPNSDIYSVRKVMSFLENREEISKLIFQDNKSKINVLVGLESERSELADSSIIISRYTISGKEAGVIAVIGPTRMNYKKAITNLEYLTKTVGRLLSEILDA